MTAKARSRPVKAPRRRALPAADRGEIKERPLKIGEAARALDIEAYVLRFWETQFPFLRPRHANSSHRMYEAKDLEMLRLVQRLLHVEGYTIAGAKKHIRETGLERLCSAGKNSAPSSGRSNLVEAAEFPDKNARRVIVDIRDDLKALRKLLD
jgi:DNA-binding transcriptional MerR regulator